MSSDALETSVKIYDAIEEVLNEEFLLDRERDNVLVVALCAILTKTIANLMHMKIVEEKKGVEIVDLIFEINERVARELKEKIEAEKINLEETSKP